MGIHFSPNSRHRGTADFRTDRSADILSAVGLRVVKFARNYGFVPQVADGMLEMRPGTPLEYLVRQALIEQIFSTDLQIEGLTDDAHFVISQRAIKGDHPTEAAVRKYLLRLAFVNIPGRFGQGGGAWYHRDLGVLIMDTSPDNFISAKQGIVPIDLQIAALNGSFTELADAVETLLKQAPGIRKL